MLSLRDSSQIVLLFIERLLVLFEDLLEDLLGLAPVFGLGERPLAWSTTPILVCAAARLGRLTPKSSAASAVAIRTVVCHPRNPFPLATTPITQRQADGAYDDKPPGTIHESPGNYR